MAENPYSKGWGVTQNTAMNNQRGIDIPVPSPDVVPPTGSPEEAKTGRKGCILRIVAAAATCLS